MLAGQASMQHLGELERIECRVVLPKLRVCEQWLNRPPEIRVGRRRQECGEHPDLQNVAADHQLVDTCSQVYLFGIGDRSLAVVAKQDGQLLMPLSPDLLLQ